MLWVGLEPRVDNLSKAMQQQQRVSAVRRLEYSLKMGVFMPDLPNLIVLLTVNRLVLKGSATKA
jgi:hypothetical protein